MNRFRTLFFALLLAGSAIGNVWADHGGGHGGYGHGGYYHGGYGHSSFGVVIGPYWGPAYYPPYYSYPYYPPTVIERTGPQVYIEQQSVIEPVLTSPPSTTATAPANNYWYYCAAAKGYYPYVKECPRGWQKVLPQPPGQP